VAGTRVHHHQRPRIGCGGRHARRRHQVQQQVVARLRQVATVQHQFMRKLQQRRFAGSHVLQVIVATPAQRVEEQHLAGKPAPDTYLAAAKLLGVEPGEAAVFEDALSGVAAGRAGGFGFVVGVDRVGQAMELRAHGADRVVTDLGQLLDLADPA